MRPQWPGRARRVNLIFSRIQSNPQEPALALHLLWFAGQRLNDSQTLLFECFPMTRKFPQRDQSEGAGLQARGLGMGVGSAAREAP